MLPHIFYSVIFVVVYIETALIFAFFVPGDTLLFTVGLIVATTNDLNILIAAALISCAAFLGDQTAYQLGRKYGVSFFSRKPSLNLLMSRSEVFYKKYGISAMMLSRFYPWFRTLIPFLAGASKMNFVQFLATNFLSSIAWGFGITFLGYGANSIPELKESSRYLAIFFILLTIVITIKNFYRGKTKISI